MEKIKFDNVLLSLALSKIRRRALLCWLVISLGTLPNISMATSQMMNECVSKIADFSAEIMQTAAGQQRTFQWINECLERVEEDRYLENIYAFEKATEKRDSKSTFWYWYEKAARQNDAVSQVRLGYIYMMGKYIHQDYTKARYWFERATAQNDAIAEYFLAILYLDGKGVKRNADKAFALLQRGCSGNFAPACYHPLLMNTASQAYAYPTARSLACNRLPGSQIFSLTEASRNRHCLLFPFHIIHAQEQ